MPTPPKTAAAVIGVCTARSLRSSRICAASSRVGVSTSARVVPRGRPMRLCRIGSRKATVFPLPVIAHASRSLPASAGGIGVGLDRCRARETEVFESLQQAGMKIQAGKWHQVFWLSKMRLQQVTAPSAFAISLTSTVVTPKPRRSSRSRVRGNAAAYSSSAVDSGDIGAPRLVRVHVDDVEAGEGVGLHPLAIHQQRSLAQGRHGGLQVEAPAHVDRLQRIREVFDQPPELFDAGIVGPRGRSDEDRTTGHEHVTPIERPRRRDVAEQTMALERFLDTHDFGTPRFGSGSGDDPDLVEDHRGILDEQRIGHFGARRQPLHRAAKAPRSHARNRRVAPGPWRRRSPRAAGGSVQRARAPGSLRASGR